MTIFAFQNIWGYVYQSVGLLIALFMLGMGVGAVGTGRWLEKKEPSQARARKVLAVDQLLITAALLSCQPATDLFATMAGAAGQIPLFFWLGGVGFLIGAILPLGLRSGGRQAPARNAAWLNAADYLGGAIGAMATASILLPLFGSAASLLLLAVPAAAAALLLLIQSGFSAPGPE